jgi:hypothetical protein
MRQTIFCKSFQSMSEHGECKAGVCYEKLKGIPLKERPCFMSGKTLKAPGGCDLAEFPTKEEIETEDAEFAKRFEDVGKARAAIVAHLGPWKKGVGGRGRIDCPVCNQRLSLAFSQAGMNGHIHARCDTQGCVAWIE